ncbi:olfactory receptor 1509-like [Bombina bombina]|uniref:olfactory receptor 1509-like n=1 Tax=Bombina bombina TaxID=8345 RepID=UPI00235A6829|nr:olfactory receptor 1509-like [Bombina bombina]
MTLIGNFIIIYLILRDSHLHNPMYFFLGNLACLDILSTSVTLPRLLYDSFRKQRTISSASCITQLYFSLTFISTETFLLGVMSYDRYAAICFPLHYAHLMRWKVCAELALTVWVFGLLYSLMYTVSTLRLSFCGPNNIQSFFCELRQLLQLSCNNNFINILLVFVIGGFIGLGCFLMTFLPYISIFIAVLSINTNTGRRKMFSTCGSHLTVVFMFYGTCGFNYFHPSTSYSSVSKHVSVAYTLITPFLNPLIYSFRNNDLKRAFRNGLVIFKRT